MNKVDKGGPIKRLVRSDERGSDGLNKLVHEDVVSVANVGRLHLVKIARDATGASFTLVDATTGYTLRQLKKAQGMAFLRRHDPAALAVYIEGMVGEASKTAGFVEAFNKTHALLREVCA